MVIISNRKASKTPTRRRFGLSSPMYLQCHHRGLPLLGVIGVRQGRCWFYPFLLPSCSLFHLFSIARFASKCHFVLGLCNAADADLMFSVLVPAPKHLTLERQLNKSVLIGWTPPDPPGCNQIESYHVYVDGVLKVTVKATERTRALVEGVDSNRVSFAHRVSD